MAEQKDTNVLVGSKTKHFRYRGVLSLESSSNVNGNVILHTKDDA